MSAHLVESNTYRSWANPRASDRLGEIFCQATEAGGIRGFLSRSGRSTRDREDFFSWKELTESEAPSFALVVDLNGTRNRAFSRCVSAGHHKIFITIQASCSNERVFVGSIDKWLEADPATTAGIAKLKNEILAMRQLPKGWDSYDAEAPSDTAINLAMRIIGELELIGIMPDWCVPTSDGSILLQFQRQGVTYKWEIESDGDIGIMVKPVEGDPEYLDLPASWIPRFFAERCYEVL